MVCYPEEGELLEDVPWGKHVEFDKECESNNDSEVEDKVVELTTIEVNIRVVYEEWKWGTTSSLSCCDDIIEICEKVGDE
jgi:hypothetical protein